MNDALVQQDGFASNCQKVLRFAKELYQSKPDWVTFFRETLGVSGAARNVFSNQDDYVRFEKSPEYSEIQGMVVALRNRKTPANGTEPTRVITVRLPESLHEALKAEAASHKTSMNKLCIAKLLQAWVEAEEEEAAQSAAAGARRSNASLGAKTPSPVAAQAAEMTSQPQFRSPLDQPRTSDGMGRPSFGS